MKRAPYMYGTRTESVLTRPDPTRPVISGRLFLLPTDIRAERAMKEKR